MRLVKVYLILQLEFCFLLWIIVNTVQRIKLMSQPIFLSGFSPLNFLINFNFFIMDFQISSSNNVVISETSCCRFLYFLFLFKYLSFLLKLLFLLVEEVFSQEHHNDVHVVQCHSECYNPLMNPFQVWSTMVSPLGNQVYPLDLSVCYQS